MKNRYVSAKTKVDARMKQVLAERAEKVVALQDFCADLEVIRIGSETASEEDIERENFIVDDDSDSDMPCVSHIASLYSV